VTRKERADFCAGGEQYNKKKTGPRAHADINLGILGGMRINLKYQEQGACCACSFAWNIASSSNFSTQEGIFDVVIVKRAGLRVTAPSVATLLARGRNKEKLRPAAGSRAPDFVHRRNCPRAA
jgi:hypothetical protein